MLFGDDRFTKHTLHFAWHLRTLAFLGLAAPLTVLAAPGGASPAAVAAIIAATYAVQSVVALVGSRRVGSSGRGSVI